MSVGFSDFTRRVMDEILSWEPVLATQVGWHRYDSMLGDPRQETLKTRAERCQELSGSLGDISASSLSTEESLDRDLAIHILDNKRFEYAELRKNERGCDGPNVIGHSLFFLFAREHPGVEERIEAIIGRIGAVPDYLPKCREALTRPYKSWNEAAYEVGAELPSLFKSMETYVSSRTDDKDAHQRIHAVVKEATDAIEEHTSYLKREVLPSGMDDYAITPEEYARYLEVKGYDFTPQQLLEIGEAHLGLCKHEIARLSRQITTAGNPLDAIMALKSDHPVDSESVLWEYRSAVERSREFIVAKDLCTVPDAEDLVVMETPEFMRPMFAFAGQFEPGKFDGDRTGLFLVTPPGDSASMLREHSHAGIVNTAVHEGYPGHHLQGICSNTHPSCIRVLSTSPDFSEGWALYTEQLMVEQGFNDSTFGRLAVMNDLLYRIVRLIVEVRLVLGTLDIEGGAKMLSSECSVDIGAARSEARACAMSPTYFSSYLLGKLATDQLRGDARRALGSRFSLRFFHDSLLYSGCLPMNFMRRSVTIKMRDEYGVQLAPGRESLHSYAMRVAKDGLA